MKRAGKCAGKRKYPLKSLAVDMAHWKYVNKGVVLGVYECPTCLDFHLTSKYCNIKSLHKAYKKAILSLAEQKRILASLDNKKLSTPRTFWSWIRGIIKVNRI